MNQLIMVPDRIAASFRDAYEWSGDPESDFTCHVPGEGWLHCRRTAPRARNPWATILLPANPWTRIDEVVANTP